MFNILINSNVMGINGFNPGLNDYIKSLRLDAKQLMGKYDDMILAPEKTVAQRRFLVHTRYSFQSHIESNFSFLVLLKQMTKLLENSAELNCLLSKEETDFKSAVNLYLKDIEEFSYVINTLMHKKLISMSENHVVPDSTDNDFLNIGFIYHTNSLNSFGRHGEREIGYLMNTFCFSNLAKESEPYYELERDNLRFCLKDAYRIAAFNALLLHNGNGVISPPKVEGFVSNVYQRFFLANLIIEDLFEHGYRI